MDTTVLDKLQTRTGAAFTVRPAADTDDAALAEFFEHVTKDDLRFRFLSSVTKVTRKQIAEMTHVDHIRTEDFLVSEKPGGPIVANAMLAADKQMNTAEVAIAVACEHKGKGLESALLDYVAQQAKARGIKKLQAIEARDNHCAIELERNMGFKLRGIEDDPMLVLLEKAM